MCLHAFMHVCVCMCMYMFQFKYTHIYLCIVNVLMLVSCPENLHPLNSHLIILLTAMFDLNGLPTKSGSFISVGLILRVHHLFERVRLFKRIIHLKGHSAHGVNHLLEQAWYLEWLVYLNGLDTLNHLLKWASCSEWFIYLNGLDTLNHLPEWAWHFQWITYLNGLDILSESPT